jgi:deoxycytidylate deaminase
MEIFRVESSKATVWKVLESMAQTSACKGKHACALVDKKGRIVSLGVSRHKTHPKYGSKPPYRTLHAEGDAIFSCKKQGIDPKDLRAYVLRRGRTYSKPCPCCMAMLESYGISRVYHT